MSDYLPLCAFRQALLPAECRACAWWQTTGSFDHDPEAASEKRRRWMTSLENTWGSVGLLLEGSTASSDRRGPDGSHARGGDGSGPRIVASISFAPSTVVPRLHELPFGPLPSGSGFLFCLWVEDGGGRFAGRRVLHKALGHLKDRGVEEAFAVAGADDGADLDDHVDGAGECRFFSAAFLAANGFQEVREGGGLVLMKADLRGLLSLIGQVETAVRRVLNHEPAPSPAAWSRRGMS